MMLDRRRLAAVVGIVLMGSFAVAAYAQSAAYPQNGSSGQQGGGMMGGMMSRGTMGGGYVGQQASTTANGSSNGTAGWNWQGMWSWCRGMMSDFGG
ncbi:MAG: hypothetical protein ABSG92_03575 [Conexivisphaerales archaeon]